MSEPRSRSRSAPRRTSSTPRTTPRRPTRAQGSATATMERPPEPLEGPELAPAPAQPARPGSSARSRRGDRRRQRPRAPRHRLLLACTVVLALGMVGVLLLNTIISQGAFRQFELEVDLILLAEDEESLARAVQQAESPVEVEKRARALGMVPAAAPVFLRLADGAILGEPVPAPAPTGRVSFKDAPGLQPGPRPRLAGTSPDAAEEEADPGDATDASAGEGPTPVGEPVPEVDPALDPTTGLEDPAVEEPESTASPSPTSPVIP